MFPFLIIDNWSFFCSRNFNLSVEREHELEEVLTFSHLLCEMTRSYLKCLVCRFSTTFMVFMNPTSAICLVHRFPSKIHIFLWNMHSLLLGNTVHFVLRHFIVKLSFLIRINCHSVMIMKRLFCSPPDLVRLPPLVHNTNKRTESHSQLWVRGKNDY